ncbi:MAG: DUF493 family protein [Rhodanobacteraceae bacterium]
MSTGNGSGNGKEKKVHGFRFPGEFEITAVGSADGDLKARVPQLLQKAGLKVLHETVTHRPSRQGNYIAVRIQIHCQNREQYEAAHEALRADEAIHYTI